jgi:hypothetical protein
MKTEGMDSFNELVSKLRMLADSVAVAAPQSGGRLQAERRWVFESNGSSVSLYETESVHIDWPRVDIAAWIAGFDGFKEIPALLEESAHIGKWIATRVSGSDADSVRTTGLRLFVQEFVVGVMDDATWRVSEERFLDAREKLRILLTQGRVFYRTLMFLHGITIAEPVDLTNIVLRAPTRDELLSAFNRSHSEGPDRGALSCGAVLEAIEYVPIGDIAVSPANFTGLLWAIQIWAQHAIVGFATLHYSGWMRASGATRPAAQFYPLFLQPPILERAAEFRAFWQQANVVLRQPPTSLGVALRRLSTMINQERREDRILDLCIILEALFQHKDDENQELSYRLSLRTAHFVGTDQASRVAVWEAVRAGYRLRSKIAHGNTASEPNSATEAELERIVFVALRNYCIRASTISRSDVAKTIIRQLEEYMLERRE